MNRFDARLSQLPDGLNGWLSDRWRDIKEVVKKPEVLLNPALAVNVATTPGARPVASQVAQVTKKAASQAAQQIRESKPAQFALALLANPALAQVAAEADLARKNPAEALAIAAVAASAITAGGSLAALGNTAAGALASGSAALKQGLSSEDAAKVATANGLQSVGNIALDLLGNSGLDLSALDAFISPQKIQAEINKLLSSGAITPAQAQEIQRTIAMMRAEGKSDNEIIGELVNSQFFAELSRRELETLTHPVLYREFYAYLISQGYAPDVANRVAMQAATRYAAEFAAKSTQQFKARAPGNLDPKLFLALIPIAAYFLIK